MAKSYSIVSISTSTQAIVINGNFTNLFIKDNTSTFTLATEFEIQNHSLSSANKKYKVSDSAYSALTDRTTIFVAPELITSSTSTSGVSVPALPVGANVGPNFGKITNTTHYLLNFKQSNFVVLSNQINTASSSLSIPGRYVLNYGEDIHQNILELTESFAGATAPDNPAVGQLWYDTGASTIKVYNGSSWTALLGASATGASISQGGTGRTQWQNGIMKYSGSSFTTTNLTNAEVTTGLGYTPVNKAGDTMTGNLTLNADPSTDLGAATKKYVDARDYLNLDPLAGVLEENIVPTYSDFQFSLGAGGTQSFALTDDQNIEVVYFHVNTPTGKIRAWRAYRFVETESFIFDPEPLTVSFQNTNERISGMMNVGTQFAYLELFNDSTSAVRRVLVKTNGSSKSTNWTLFANVTAITSSRTNMFLLVDAAGDRILRTTLGSGNSNVTLDVFDSSLTLLRSQIIYTTADVTNIDQSGSGKTSPSNTINFAYFPGNCVSAFTWNKFSENLLMTYSSWNPDIYSSSGAPVPAGPSLTISWNIPKSWFINGVGSLTNLVPIKPSGFRYHKIPDSTWDTLNGGMNAAGQGTAITVTTDEFAKKITSCVVGSWSSEGFAHRKSTTAAVAQDWPTVGNISLSYNSYVSIPDASPWSKNILSQNTHVIDDNIQFLATSNKYGGTKLINTKFSTSTFSSSSPSSPDDTLKLDGAAWQYTPSPSAATAYSTTVLGSTGVYSKIVPGSVLEQITVTDGVRTYTPTSFTLPSIPSTIGSVTGITWNGQIVYNGNSSDRKFWALVKATATNSGESLYIAHYSSGSWSNIYGPFMVSQIATGNTNRGDSQNQWSTFGCPVLTNGGRFLSSIGIDVTGGRSYYILEYNVNTGVATVHAWNKFRPPSLPYTDINPYYGTSFGYSTKFGYFCVMSTNLYSAAYFSMSKNISGAGAELTEEQWFTGSTTRYQIAMTTEPAIGLFAYIQQYPIFIGGYYTKVPSTNLALIPNAAQYVYAEKTGTSRDEVTLSTSVDYLPNSFSRVVLAEIVTDSENVLSLTSYKINSKLSNFKLKNGSAASPSLSFIDDSGTGLYKPNAATLGFSTNATEKMQIDSSGNLGLGTTASQWSWGSGAGPANAIDIASVGSIFSIINIPGQGTEIGRNFYVSGTNYIYKVTGPASRYSQLSGVHSWYTAPAGSPGNTATFTKVMMLDVNGNLGIGTTSPQQKLDVAGIIKATSGGNTIYLNPEFGSGVETAVQSAQNALLLCTNDNERVRIDTNGNVGIGTSAPNGKLEVVGPSGVYTRIGTAVSSFYTVHNGLTDTFMYTQESSPFRLGTGFAERMRITGSGEIYIAGTTDQGAYNLQVNGSGIWAAGAYVNGSDLRLKENIQALDDGLAVINQLRPVTFKYKSEYSRDQSIQPGFIAQELQEVLTDKSYADGVVQSGPEHLNVAYQALIPLLTKAVQELSEEVKQLKAEIQVLKGSSQ